MQMALVVVVLCSSCALHGVNAHTWLTYPPAHYDMFPRNAVTQTPCEPYTANVSNTDEQSTKQHLCGCWSS